MKEIMAIIRPKKVSKTKEVLDSLGFPAMNAIRVMGRGKQRAILNEISFEINEPELLAYGRFYALHSKEDVVTCCTR